MVKANGEIDFLDESLCGNGRSVVFREKLKVKRDGRMIPIIHKTINLPPLDEIDGLIFAFITRRNTIMPFAQELTPEQGILAYLWGESTHSMATNPAKAGESVRIVGTDDFIIGPRGQKVNKFHSIIMELINRYPGKVRFFMYNTGGMGEIIEAREEAGKQKKQVIRKADRVPIKLMAAIQRGDLRGTNSYEPCVLGTRGIVSVEGKPLSEWDVHHLYSQEHIDTFLKDLVQGRRKFTEEIAREGLKQEIIRSAEKAFTIEPGFKKTFPVGVTSKTSPTEPVVIVRSEEPISRPRKPGSWRWR
jgi:phosphoenolpyruvate carboxykinase (ATP)